MERAINLLEPPTPNQALELFDEVLRPQLFQCGAVEQEIMKRKIANFRPMQNYMYLRINQGRVI